MRGGIRSSPPDRGSYQGRSPAIAKAPSVFSGKPGTTVNLHANYFKVTTSTAQLSGALYVYGVSFSREVVMQGERMEALRGLKDNLNKVFGVHVYLDECLYSLNKVE